MAIHIRFSAPLARIVGAPRLALSLPDGATAAELVERLGSQYPELAPRLTRAVLVVGGQTVSPSTPLADGAEVALLLPIAGGSPHPEAHLSFVDLHSLPFFHL